MRDEGEVERYGIPGYEKEAAYPSLAQESISWVRWASLSSMNRRLRSSRCHTNRRAINVSSPTDRVNMHADPRGTYLMSQHGSNLGNDFFWLRNGEGWNRGTKVTCREIPTVRFVLLYQRHSPPFHPAAVPACIAFTAASSLQTSESRASSTDTANTENQISR